MRLTYHTYRDANYLASRWVRCDLKMREIVLEYVRHSSAVRTAVHSSCFIAFVLSRWLHHSNILQFDKVVAPAFILFDVDRQESIRSAIVLVCRAHISHTALLRLKKLALSHSCTEGICHSSTRPFNASHCIFDPCMMHCIVCMVFAEQCIYVCTDMPTLTQCAWDSRFRPQSHACYSKSHTLVASC